MLCPSDRRGSGVPGGTSHCLVTELLSGSSRIRTYLLLGATSSAHCLSKTRQEAGNGAFWKNAEPAGKWGRQLTPVTEPGRWRVLHFLHGHLAVRHYPVRGSTLVLLHPSPTLLSSMAPSPTLSGASLTFDLCPQQCHFMKPKPWTASIKQLATFPTAAPETSALGIGALFSSLIPFGLAPATSKLPGSSTLALGGVFKEQTQQLYVDPSCTDPLLQRQRPPATGHAEQGPTMALSILTEQFCIPRPHKVTMEWQC